MDSQAADPSPSDALAAPAAGSSTQPRNRQRRRGVRDEAEPARRTRGRSREPAAGGHIRQAVAAGDELKRDDVETVQSTMKRARSPPCRSRSRSNDPDGNARTMRCHDMRFQLHSPSSAPPGPSPWRDPAVEEPTLPAPAGLEPAALHGYGQRGGAARVSARTKTFDAPPTALPFSAGCFDRDRRVPRAGSGAPIFGRTATTSGSGEAPVARLRSRRLEPSSTTPQTNTRTDRTASRPTEDTDCRAARTPARPKVKPAFEVDADEALAMSHATNRYKTAWGIERSLSPEQAQPTVEPGEVLANRYKTAWGIERSLSPERAQPTVDPGEVLANRYKTAWGLGPYPTLQRSEGGLSEAALSV